MICSLCVYELLEDSTNNIHLIDEESKYLKIITKHLQDIELINSCNTSNDQTSKVICKECAKHLDDFHDFCDFIEGRQKYFSHNSSVLIETAIDIEKPIDQSKVEELLQVNQTFVAEATYIAEEPEVEELSSAIKFELEGEEESSISKPCDDDFDNDAERDESDNSDYDKPLKEVNEQVEQNSQDNVVNKAPVLRQRRIKNGAAASQSKTTSKKTQTAKKKKEPQPISDKYAEKYEDMILNEQLISQNLSLLCEICAKVETTFSKLQTHYRVLHKVKGYLKCCERRFTKRSRLCEHLKLHLNPEIYKCQICNRNMKTAYSLQKHNQDVHPKQEDLKFECNICGKKNANKHSAQRHREKHNGAREFCAQCGKNFKTKYSLEYHIKAIHEQHINPYICDTCGREYKCKSSFTLHVAEHQGNVQVKLVQCEICKEWVKRLDRHMYKHNTVDTTCKYCGKQVASKSSLRYHIEKEHKEQKDLPCTLCGRIFKYKKNLKEHMAMHTNTKDYKCQHCDREFRSSANMYAHIKRDHVEQWMQAQLARKKGPPPDDGVNGSQVEEEKNQIHLPVIT